MEPNQMQDLVNPDAGLPQHMPPTMQGMPDFSGNGPRDIPSNAGDGHKKALLQKLMSNLLSKPGRSMHEIINGVKSAIGAYKNYAKEWDNISSLMGEASAGGMKGSPNKVKDILQQVQAKKGMTPDGSGGPGMQSNRPTGMPQQAQGTPNLPQQAFGNPVRPTMPEQANRPTGMPQQAQGTPNLPQQAFGNPGQPVPPSPQPARPPQMPEVANDNAFIAGQPQQSNFNRPAPVNSLGIFGH